MGKKMKMTVVTPSEIYSKLILRAYELNLTNREYYLALAMQDLGIVTQGETLTEQLAIKLKTHIKKLDQQDNQLKMA